MRLLRDGWSGVHVDESFGHGVMPLTFEALKGQRFRWCFGGIQILRMHWRSMLPGGGGRANRMTLGQRWAYLSGAIQWYGDLIAMIFFVFLLIGAGNIALGGGMLFRKLTAFMVAAIPLLVVLGFVRAVALIRRGTGASWSDAIGAFMIWQSTSLVVARASLQALFARKAEFLRTPKTNEDARLWDAIRGNRAEVLFALLGMAGIAIGLWHVTTFAGALTAGLLILPTVAFASAPLNSLAAQRASLPPELAARRRAELRRGYFGRRSVSAVIGVGLAAASVALTAGLLAPGGHDASPPQLVQPREDSDGSPDEPGSTPTIRTSPNGSETTTNPGGSNTEPTTSSGATPTPTTSTPATTTVPTTTPTGSTSTTSPPATTTVPTTTPTGSTSTTSPPATTTVPTTPALTTTPTGSTSTTSPATTAPLEGQPSPTAQRDR